MGTESTEGGKDDIMDKIIRLRKKNGWSQEELAEKDECIPAGRGQMGRGSDHPQHGKDSAAGELFGVTLDYLLKDERETEERLHSGGDSGTGHIGRGQ